MNGRGNMSFICQKLELFRQFRSGKTACEKHESSRSLLSKIRNDTLPNGLKSKKPNRFQLGFRGVFYQIK